MNRDPKLNGTSEPLDQNRIERWARVHRIENPTAEKVLWLTRVLHRISTSALQDDFALIGGSAIVFLYRDMYRFSTDLDLDFVADRHLGHRGLSQVIAREKRDQNALRDIAKTLGMTFVVRRAPKDRFVQYELSYPSLYTRRGTVELDISYRYGHSVLGIVARSWPVEDDETSASFMVNTLREEELYAGKAIAMFDIKERLDFPDKIHLFTKRKIRHLFDIYLLARDVQEKRSKVNVSLFRDLFLLFGMTRIPNFEYFHGNAIGSYTDADVTADLLPVVPRGYPVPAVKDMKWTVRKFLDRFVTNYSDREHRFMEDFRAGLFRPKDLFATGSIADRLEDTQYYREILGMVAPLKKGKRAQG
jgi:predicted nucleotidyltransferase component of viral defense system